MKKYILPLMLLLVLISCGKKKDNTIQENESDQIVKTETVEQSEISDEHILAMIDADRTISKDHESVIRFRNVLDKLTLIYTEDRHDIGNMSIKLKEMLKDEGVDENLYNIMEGLSQLFKTNKANQSYASWCALYSASRTGPDGVPHAETIEGLKGIVKAFGYPE